MGFWSALFGGDGKSKQPAMIVTISDVTVRPNTPEEERASQLLKEATAKHDAKDLDGAIKCLRDAYALLSTSDISYPIATYVRLPLYLQKAGRYEEAVIEFEKLLIATPAVIAKEFSHVSKPQQNEIVAMNRSVIFDKMRLAAQREKQFAYAVYYRVLSEANRSVGSKGMDDLDSCKDPESWAKSIDSLLIKAKKEAHAETLVDRCMVFTRSCTESSLGKLETDIAALLEIKARRPGGDQGDKRCVRAIGEGEKEQ